MIVGIHQPNFIPLIGLFQRIKEVELFIFLDHVQIPTGKSLVTRNKLLIGGDARWISIPIYKAGRKGQKICESRINYETDFTKKHLKTIELNYKKCPFYDIVYERLADFFSRRYDKISDLNIEIIKWLCNQLNIKSEFKRSSQLIKENKELENIKGNELILELCKVTKATTYISGNGCKSFIKPKTFEENGIKFFFQNIVQNKYKQNNIGFTPNLSLLDMVMNIGFESTSEILLKNKLIKKNLN